MKGKKIKISVLPFVLAKFPVLVTAWTNGFHGSRPCLSSQKALLNSGGVRTGVVPKTYLRLAQGTCLMFYFSSLSVF